MIAPAEGGIDRLRAEKLHARRQKAHRLDTKPRVNLLNPHGQHAFQMLRFPGGARRTDCNPLFAAIDDEADHYNRLIAGIEDQLHPTNRKNIEEQVRLKTVQLAELELSKPAAVPQPAETLTPE